MTMATQMGVQSTNFHQCMYGLEACDDELGLAPAYKPTTVLTNHEALPEVHENWCTGGHRHVHLIGKHAWPKAATYYN